MSSGYDKNEISTKMDKSLASFKKDLNTIRTGRANPAMLDLITIEAYGKKMPINQLATITVPEPRSISIQVWDKSNVVLIDNAIKNPIKPLIIISQPNLKLIIVLIPNAEKIKL